MPGIHDVMFITKPDMLLDSLKRFKSLDTALYVKIILILPESDLEFKRNAVKIGCLYKDRSIILNLPD